MGRWIHWTWPPFAKGSQRCDRWWIWAWKEEGWRGHPFNPANNVDAIPAGRLELHTLGNPRIIELLNLGPLEHIASARFCLAHRQERESVIYQPDSGPFTVDLTGRERTYQLEWHNPNSGDTIPSPEPVVGGGWRLLAPPWRGDVVAYLRTWEG